MQPDLLLNETELMMCCRFSFIFLTRIKWEVSQSGGILMVGGGNLSHRIKTQCQMHRLDLLRSLDLHEDEHRERKKQGRGQEWGEEKR